MTHYSEDDLILHYYGEGQKRGDVEYHLDTCTQCSAAFQSIATTLQLVAAPDVPERDDSYGSEVWQRIRARLPERPVPWWQAWSGGKPIAVAAAVAALVIVAFVAGRLTPHPSPGVDIAMFTPSIDPDAGARVRLAAIGDHLERSERVLLDLVNADGESVDLSAQQAWAADLISSGRLYRDAATRPDDALVGDVLDDLERSLLDIVHGPSMPTSAELNAVRARLDATAVLFKVRVLADELHDREVAPLGPSGQAGPVQPRKTT